MQLKAIIKNYARENNISPQIALQYYMLEKILERISFSKYRDYFIFKGGFLIAAMVGVSYRSTMDMDATIKNFPLNEDSIEKIFKELCILNNDEINFTFLNVENIRENDTYKGYRVHLKGIFSPLAVDLKIDITTGDSITPSPIDFQYRKMLENKYINIKSYNLETIIAEKIETIITRGVTTTRIRDFYDVFILSSIYSNNINFEILKDAIENTCKNRSSNINGYELVCRDIRNDTTLRNYWINYQKSYEYAQGIDFDECIEKIIYICNEINKL